MVLLLTFVFFVYIIFITYISNKIYNIEVEMNTRQGRQRLYDLMAEVRRICHKQRHAMTQFQRLQFIDFSEDIQEQVNLWTGRCNVQLVNQMVLLET